MHGSDASISVSLYQLPRPPYDTVRHLCQYNPAADAKTCTVHVFLTCSTHRQHTSLWADCEPNDPPTLPPTPAHTLTHFLDGLWRDELTT